MHMSGEGLLAILLAGLIAGALAGRVVDGGGFGIIGDIAVGIVGALIGTWALARVGVHIPSGFVGLIIVAFIGAVILLLILRLLTGGFRGRTWGARRRWW